MATLEYEIGGHKAINQEISRRWPSRSYMSIVLMRRTPRSREALQALRQDGNNVDILHPSPTILDTDDRLDWLCERDIIADFEATGYPGGVMARNIALTPITMRDISLVYQFFGVKIRKPRPRKNATLPSAQRRPPKKGKRKRERYRRHQDLYQKGPKVLLGELLSERSDVVPVTMEQVHGVFDPIFTIAAPHPGEIKGNGQKITADPSPFEYDEVEMALRSLNQASSPGPDGVNARELRKIPTEIITHILNNFLAFKQVPDELRISRTVFIPKNDSPSGAEELRPITISPILLRLLSRLILTRFSGGHRFHDLQGGFECDRAATSNLLLLQGAMRLAKREKRSFMAASIDLRKAFDSVGHETLLQALASKGADPFWVSLVRGLYRDSSTVFWLEGTTDNRRIPLRRGVKQGDPLSPFLFNSVMDPLLYLLNDLEVGFSVQSARAGAMAYADDLLLLSDTVAGLQQAIWKVEQYFATVRLEISPSKTKYFGWTFDTARQW